jgi:hypothetical protein
MSRAGGGVKMKIEIEIKSERAEEPKEFKFTKETRN